MKQSDLCTLSCRMRSGTNRASEDIIEAQNREYAERIASKTSFLKTVALDMESEAKEWKGGQRKNHGHRTNWRLSDSTTKV